MLAALQGLFTNPIAILVVIGVLGLVGLFGWIAWNDWKNAKARKDSYKKTLEEIRRAKKEGRLIEIKLNKTTKKIREWLDR